MAECQMRVTCEKCGYTTDDVYAVGGAVLDGGFFSITIACATSRELIDGDAGCLDDFSVQEPDGSERDLTLQDVEDTVDVVAAFMSSAECPRCGEDHPAWNEATAACPACGATGCRVEIA